MKKFFYFLGLCCVLFLIIGVASYSLALEVPVFSPLRYTVGAEGTSVFTETVQMGNVLSGEFHLVVQNGSEGENKVDLVEVYLAGKRVVKLTSKKDLIDKKVKLLQESEMRIQLTGPQNSFVVVSVIAKKLTQVPLVIRMAQEDAQAAMTAATLKVKKKPTLASHGFIPAGSVTSQTPQAGAYVKEKSKASITVSTGPAQIITLLPGEASTSASGAVIDYDIDDKVTPAEIETAPSGFRIARTQLEFGFTDDATVDQVNTLLQSVNAVIIGMLKGVNQLIVRIPDPGDLPGLNGVIATLQASPVVRYVLKATMSAPESLPPNFNILDPSPPWDKIDHHLDIRAHAAWNVRSLVQHQDVPYLIVADGFGEGEPDTKFNFFCPDPSEFDTTSAHWHGYHVLGIIGGTFGGDTSDRGIVTGIYPGRLPLRVVDLQKYTQPMARLKIVESLKTVHRAVVNTSQGLPCNGGFVDRSCVEPAALSWIERLRGTGLYCTGLTGPESLESTFLHVTAAGNVREEAPNDRDTTYTSDWTAARRLPLVHPGNGNPIMNLTNTLVIENRKKSPTPLESLGCLAADSKTPGDLSGIGSDVFSFMGSKMGADYSSGTSMATPQVAGLAAYLWAIKPDLTPQQIMDILIQTADIYPCGNILLDPMPLVDAYGAVLALDRSYSDARVRGTLLDVADWTGALGGNGIFTEHDIQVFLNAFEAANGSKDYSRFDLNGDGKTGGSEKRTFNLDMGYPPTDDVVHQIVDGAHVSFDENELTDMDILCYYAYSPLYSGSDTKRKGLLRDRCAELTEEHTFPSTIESGGSGELKVRAGYIVPDGSTQWKEGINISITVSGGTAASSIGTTDMDGYFSTTIQHDGTASKIIVTVNVTDSGDREVTKTAEAATGRKEVSWELTWLRSVAVTSGDPCDYCREEQNIGGDQYTYPPLPLPATIAATCPSYTGATATVREIGAGNLTVDFSGSAARAISQCNPYRVVETTANSSGGGRITTAGTYTAAISASPSFTPPGVLAEYEYLYIRFSIQFVGGDYRRIMCVWGKTLQADSQCCDEGPQGQTCVPVGPFTVDIDVPEEGINTWQYDFSISSGRWNYIGGNPGDVSVSGAEVSIRPKP